MTFCMLMCCSETTHGLVRIDRSICGSKVQAYSFRLFAKRVNYKGKVSPYSSLQLA